MTRVSDPALRQIGAWMDALEVMCNEAGHLMAIEAAKRGCTPRFEDDAQFLGRLQILDWTREYLSGTREDFARALDEQLAMDDEDWKTLPPNAPDRPIHAARLTTLLALQHLLKVDDWRQAPLTLENVQDTFFPH